MKEKRTLRKILHNFFKILSIFLIGTAVINILLFAAVYGNHKSKLKKEAAYLNASGQFVDVNGHSMHIIVEGNENSEVTLVFLHGSNVVDDSVALRPLFDKLKDQYKLVYVERSGVGFSEVSGSDRDIDNILEETRLALKNAGVEGPFVVVPVGTAGVEVVHWANKYPEELRAVIGINMTYPDQYADITVEEYCGFFDYLMVPFYSIGGQRFVQSVYPENTYGIYTEAQMLTRKALISKGGYTKDMYNENLTMVDNANAVAAEGWPEELDMYLIYSNPLIESYRNTNDSVKKSYEDAVEQNPDVDYVKAYNEYLREYFADKDNVTLEEVAGPTRIYTFDPETLAGKVSAYINEEILQ